MSASRRPIIAFSLVALLLIWTTLFIFFRGYRADRLRERLGVLLSQLFDYAAGGQIAFAHPAYVGLRAMLLAAIDGADRVTFGRLLVAKAVFALGRSTVPDPEGNLRRDLERLSSTEACGHLLDVHNQMRLEAARHMVFGSPLLWCWLIAGWVRAAIAGEAGRLWTSPVRLVPGIGLLEAVLPAVKSADFR